MPRLQCRECDLRAALCVEVGVDQTIDQPVEAGRDRVETEEVLLDATYASLEVGPQDPAAGSPPERFAPGRLLLDRYRIVTKLGQGGMGEVYRADDLVLDQPVALKFLPEGGDAIGARLDQLRAESAPCTTSVRRRIRRLSRWSLSMAKTCRRC